MSAPDTPLAPLTADQYAFIVAAYSEANAQLTAANFELQARLGAALAELAEKNPEQ